MIKGCEMIVRTLSGSGLLSIKLVAYCAILFLPLMTSAVVLLTPSTISSTLSETMLRISSRTLKYWLPESSATVASRSTDDAATILWLNFIVIPFHNDRVIIINKFIVMFWHFSQLEITLLFGGCDNNLIYIEILCNCALIVFVLKLTYKAGDNVRHCRKTVPR
ncbi:Uncharacterised protein [Vibrio cholerae]|nr:Uncharacterised protein [Vibrio cholerae]CSB32397.1 Uncharacterised protein [Vibrio cholerae]CSB70561.1 Uncharacterised protein [Vibrio cholerae]CSC10445.1 Uncharacterised protein [Vibrio cholerae]